MDNLKENGILFSTINKVLEGKGEINSKEYKDSISQLSRTAPNTFTDSRSLIRVKCMDLKKCKINCQPKSMLQSNKFLQTFQHIIKQNRQLEETMKLDHLKHFF